MRHRPRECALDLVALSQVVEDCHSLTILPRIRNHLVLAVDGIVE